LSTPSEHSGFGWMMAPPQSDSVHVQEVCEQIMPLQTVVIEVADAP
jgi:hypothetical protein